MHSLTGTRTSCSSDRRSQTRFPVAASVRIVAGRARSGDIEVTRIEGRIINVSVSAVLIALEQPVEFDRIWIRVADCGHALSECVVIRYEACDDDSHHYAVKFTCDWSATVISKLLARSEEHTSELQSRENLVCRLLLEKKEK